MRAPRCTARRTSTTSASSASTPKGAWWASAAFSGLFTSAAYVQLPKSIPLLRQKAEYVLAQLGRSSTGHAGKALANIIDTFPRDLLIQIDADELADTALAILHLQERQRVRLFVHRDRFHRFYICLVYMPRERYNTNTRRAVQELLTEAFGATDVQFEPQLSEAVLARVYFELRVPPGQVANFDHAALEAKILEATRNWTDELRDALHDRFGEERGSALFKRYGEAFRADYRANYTTRLAVHDVQRMESLPMDGGGLALSLYRPMPAASDELRFKMFTLGKPATLSSTLPMLENMGLIVEEESPSKIKRSDGPRVWLHDFVLHYPNAGALDLDHVQPRFQSAFARVWSGDMENDGFNRLVLRAGLQWRQVMVLRAYCKYLRQGRSAFSEAYMQEALDSHPKVAARLIALFESRFDPAAHATDDARKAACDAIVDELHNAFEAIVSLDEDRILRAFLAVILATMRVSYFQRDEQGEERTWLAIKVNPAAVPDLPAPLPRHEIFVYSPRVEGVHLRGGDVARGGLRWSDRREDFRTEVLGLMKAQVVKNAVIVPVGSKGGFVPKRLPVSEGRDAIAAEGVACYQMFVSGLLDVTDNLAGGEIVPPVDVVRHDPDDPYLVVAADKGTATFSDIANEVATSRGFWLGDAFASGGSQGYDHKGMGITAKGAWESVKRHFRELGTDTQTEPFTVVGIGDMSGDVFGNGMLLSRHIALVGAFNHLHIFLDPDPDVTRSFAERERLFALPRSSWADYDDRASSPPAAVSTSRARRNRSRCRRRCSACSTSTRPA